MVLWKVFSRALHLRQLLISLFFAIISVCFVLGVAAQASNATPQPLETAVLKADNPKMAIVSPQITESLLITQSTLTVTKVGNGAGRIASAPVGIDCGIDCTEAYEQGTLVTLTASADPGSTFTGWQGACTGAGAVCAVTVTTLTNVTAVFTLNQYQLTAAKAGNGNGKVTSIPAGIDCGNDCAEFYVYGAVVTLTATADPSATFAGWSGACTGTSATCVTSIDSAKSATAIFILNQYTFTLTKSGTGSGRVVSVPSGIDCGNACTASYPHGTTLNLTATANVGSTFAGWQGACTGITTCTVTMDAAKEVTALFTLNQYTLAVQKTGNGSGTVSSSPSGIDCGNSCTTAYGHGSQVNLTANAAPNTRFTGWSGACSGTDTLCTVTMDATKTVTATFVLKQYTLAVTKNGNGLGKVTGQPGALDCGSTCSTLANHGTVITLTATAESTSLFTGWQGACTTTTPTCMVTMDAAKAVTATFALQQYTLAAQQQGTGAGLITSQPAGITCGSDCTQQFDHGTVVTLTATAAISSTFTGWQGACTGNNPLCTVTMSAAKALSATFTIKQYALTVLQRGTGTGMVSSRPPGIDCGINCTQTVQHGTQLTLTATAADNSIFTGWQGACTGALPTCAITVNATQQLTATFTLKQYAVTVTPTGNGNGLITSSPSGITCGITCTVTLEYGKPLTLTATAATDSLFTGWQGACTGLTPSCIVTVDANKGVTATFTLKQYALTVDSLGTGTGIVTSTPPGVDCGITCTVTLNHGTRITVTATAAISSDFLGWGGACSGVTSLCTLTMDSPKEITATFGLKVYDLVVSKTGKGGGTVTSSPAGIDCGLSCTFRAQHGTVITLTATNDAISTFTGWQGACSGSASTCILTLTAAQAVTATFSHQQYPLTVTKSGSGAGIVTSLPAAIDCGITCTTLIEHGTAVTLTATAGAHSAFAGWSGACNGLDACVVTMNAAQSITATFTGEPVVSLSAGITATPTLAMPGQMITYTYWITNTGDLSVTVAALSTKGGSPRFTSLSAQTVLTVEGYLLPGDVAMAVQQSVAPRCNSAPLIENTLTVTGTTSSGLITTTQASLTLPITDSVLPPQVAANNTIYIGCTIQMAMGLQAAEEQPAYDMVVIVGEAPKGLIIQGAQSLQRYRDAFTLQEQTNALLNEGCPTLEGCRSVRRLVIEQGKILPVELIEVVKVISRIFMPLVRR